MKLTQPQSEYLPGPQSLIDHIKRLKAREHLTSECISLKVEMGIRALDNTRKADHQQFISTAEKLITEVSTIKYDLQSIITDQSAQSRKLVEETHNTYESTISVLQSTINSLRRSLSLNFHGQEILNFTMDIHNLIFNTVIPNNQQLTNVLKAQFNNVCNKIDCLRHLWFLP